jgi:DNA-binding NarL/FixJ family response regulator
VALGAVVLVALLVVLGLILRRNRKLALEKEGADVVIEEALSDTPLAEDLTDREREILPLLAAGLTSPQIADRMCLSLPTIKWYRKRLLEKFGVANTAELISRAKEQGVL